MGRVLFDFDGTLGHRPGGWSQCLIDVLDELWPGHGLAAHDVRPPMGDGFPWHHPERAHVDQSADEWWEYLRPVIDGAYARAGVPDAVARRAGARVRTVYCDPSRFRVLPGAVRALTGLRGAGWEVVILSNHVPELSAIIDAVALGAHIDGVFSSGSTGYEKPHSAAYRTALHGADPGACVMIGDNLEADVVGAERVGLRGILVGHQGAGAGRPATDIAGAVTLVLGS